MWVKLDDRFPEHPKVASLSLRAFHLYVAGLCYAGRNLTDGAIPRAQVAALDHWGEDGIDTAGRRHGNGNQHSNRTATVRELVTAGLWKESAVGYDIHDFLKYNPSRAQILSEREAARRRRHRSRDVQGTFARRSGEPRAASPDVTPTRPDPKYKDVTASGEHSVPAGARSRPIRAARAGPDDPMTPIADINPWALLPTADEADQHAGIIPGTPLTMLRDASPPRDPAPAPTPKPPPDPRTAEEKRTAFRQQIAEELARENHREPIP